MVNFQGCRDDDPCSTGAHRETLGEDSNRRGDWGLYLSECTLLAYYQPLPSIYNMMDVYVYYMYFTYILLYIYIYIYIDQIHYSIGLKEPFD